MALPASGVISLNQVNVELKKTATAAISMNDAAVRALAKVTSGAISMSNLHGKSSEVVFINSTNITQANIHTLMGSPTAANIYIFENHATIYASTASGTALSTGIFPAGSTLKIVNKGYIRGGGGNGGYGANGTGGAGGTALVINFPTSIDNSGGYIYGGGGGGRGGAYGGGGGGAGMVAGAAGGSQLSGFEGTAGTATAGGKSGSASNGGGGNGGGLGAAGLNGAGAGGSAGRGGYSVQTNGNAVTWIAVGDRIGSVV